MVEYRIHGDLVEMTDCILLRSIFHNCTGQTDSSSELLILVCAPIGGVLLACIVISLCLVLCLKLKTSRKKTM